MSPFRKLTRRVFLGWGAAAAATRTAAAGRDIDSHGVVDVNVSLGRWPLRRLPADEPARLASKLQSLGVTQAWVGHLDGLLYKDLTAVNTRLVEMCRRQGRRWMRPFGSINPSLPGWREELLRCVRTHGMRGIRLHPNYHHYPLDDPRLRALLHAAAEAGLIVQIALSMEDERVMHPRLRVEPVDVSPLAALVRDIPRLRVVLLNALGVLRAKPLLDIIATGRVQVEIAMLEGVGGLGNLLQQLPLDRVLFGSHSPLFYPESAHLKLQESELSSDQLRAIRSMNSERLLHTPTPNPQPPTPNT